MRRASTLAIALVGGCFEDSPPLDETTSTGATDGTPTDTGSTTAAPASTDDEDGSTAAPDTTAAEPVCGDMQVEGDEECDDGNDQPADGCTACRISLTPTWVETFGTDLAEEGAFSVAAAPMSVTVGGALAGDTGSSDIWLEVLDNDGESQGRVLVDGGANQKDAILDVRLGSEGTLWATGAIDVGAPGYSQIDVRKLSDSLDTEWAEQAGVDNLSDRGHGIAVVDGGVVVAGFVGQGIGTDAWLARYDGDGMLVDQYQCDCGGFGVGIDVAAMPDRIRALALDGFSAELWAFDAALVDEPSWEVTFEVEIGVNSVAMTPDGDTVVCGSYTGGNDIVFWLARFDPTGDERWTATHDLGDGDQTCRGVHVGAESALAVGEIRENADSARGLLARIDLGTGDLIGSQELVVESSDDTRVLAVDAVAGAPYIAGAYAIDALDDDAFVARLVP